MYFPGKEKFVAALDAAVTSSSDEAQVIAQVQAALAALAADPEVTLPASVSQPVADHYARRQLHASDSLGYVVIAMTWAPGQGTDIHDHGGAWCVEGIWQGHLAITEYEPVEVDGDRWRFEISAPTAEAGPASTGGLQPPHEYHTVRNVRDDEVAISLHVYQKPLLRCRVFTAEAGDSSGWTIRREVELSTDQQ